MVRGIEDKETPRTWFDLTEPRYRGRVVIPALDLPQGGAQLWLVAFTRTEARQVLDGENAGHLLRHTNVVRWAGPVAVIEAVPVELSLSAAEAEGADAVALLLQKPRQGPVLAAGQVALR